MPNLMEVARARIPDEVGKALSVLAFYRRVDKAVLVREALDQYLHKISRRKLPVADEIRKLIRKKTKRSN